MVVGLQGAINLAGGVGRAGRVSVLSIFVNHENGFSRLHSMPGLRYARIDCHTCQRRAAERTTASANDESFPADQFFRPNADAYQYNHRFPEYLYRYRDISRQFLLISHRNIEFRQFPDVRG